MEIHRCPLRLAMEELPPPPPPCCDGGRKDHGPRGTRPRQPLESVIEVSHIDAVLQRAAEEDLLLGGGDGADDDVLSAALWFQAHRYDLAIEGRLVAGALMAEADGAGGRQLMGASTAATACLRDPQQLWAKWIHKWFVSLISV
uniref:Uncharacterized protein n=3 Tax=Oryza TaxID=4527 RepID=Q6YTX2_ORYSJ|nr:Unknown protein [Oryza sativa]BAC84645.1 hypothetical protein [Oryza sativa Japonica Group]